MRKFRKLGIEVTRASVSRRSAHPRRTRSTYASIQIQSQIYRTGRHIYFFKAKQYEDNHSDNHHCAGNLPSVRVTLAASNHLFSRQEHQLLVYICRSFGNVEIDVMRDVYESCCQEGTTSCADWKRVSNDTVNVCSLTGITCNSDGFIIGIDASGTIYDCMYIVVSHIL